jgi:Bacteriophytochrome (light-regulated signal transduction histidine kinase)
MPFRNLPIRKRLLRVILVINGVVLTVACTAFFIYEYYNSRKNTLNKVAAIGQIIATNSTAALAFDNKEDATEILMALKAEPHVEMAVLFNEEGKLFCLYRRDSTLPLPALAPLPAGHLFKGSILELATPVMLSNHRLGTLYLRSNMGAMHERFQLYASIVIVVMALSFVLSLALVRLLTRSISDSILSLSKTASIISQQHDYSVRANKLGDDEMGGLTDAFNHMLDTIQTQNRTLRQFARTLEQKVQQRTAELQYANKELESFTYSVSHDLRAPLRAIIGYTAILEEDYSHNLDDEGKRITSVIKNNTLKMGQLIDDLLAFSRMTRQEVTREPVDMSALVQEVKNSLACQYDYGKVEWQIMPLRPAQANRRLIQQVWMNLIANALKYSSKKEKAFIQIGGYQQEGKLVYFVKDNGVGFNQQYGHKLFKIFQRLHSMEEFEGTGVGLALVHKIVARHGGEVWAEAEENKGAAFYFSLPV